MGKDYENYGPAYSGRDRGIEEWADEWRTIDEPDVDALMDAWRDRVKETQALRNRLDATPQSAVAARANAFQAWLHALQLQYDAWHVAESALYDKQVKEIVSGR